MECGEFLCIWCLKEIKRNSDSRKAQEKKKCKMKRIVWNVWKIDTKYKIQKIWKISKISVDIWERWWYYVTRRCGRHRGDTEKAGCKPREWEQHRQTKKVEKSCWQTEKAVIWYQSCSGRETTEKRLKNLDNWTVKQPWKFLKSFIFKELTFKNSKKGMNSQVVILNRIKHFIREFDPGSGWTLAACLTHASRTRNFKWDFGGFWNS